MYTCFKENRKWEAAQHLEIVVESQAPPGSERTEKRMAPFHFFTFEHLPAAWEQAAVCFTTQIRLEYSWNPDTRFFVFVFFFSFELGNLSFWVFINRDICKKTTDQITWMGKKTLYFRGPAKNVDEHQKIQHPESGCSSPSGNEGHKGYEGMMWCNYELKYQVNEWKMALWHLHMSVKKKTKQKSKVIQTQRETTTMEPMLKSDWKCVNKCFFDDHFSGEPKAAFFQTKHTKKSNVQVKHFVLKCQKKPPKDIRTKDHCSFSV